MITSKQNYEIVSNEEVSEMSIEDILLLDVENKNKLLVQIINQAVNEVNDEECNIEREKYYIRSYSGRGMYGRYCLGLKIPAGKDIVPIIIKMGTTFNLLGDQMTDNMGLGTIIYWPEVEYSLDD
ncbi:hypothetical protein [Xenorhabdus sp. KJ12.1]|uniref:hypothetical protein n=1 Tax=Xenorhabdus sp. KJ12.1 TaxID=1851571 RepID=UPI000C042FD7|nr:hypothetical protein [Xenorhabdus sp. KJ12.1]PHM72250.1 hypothetical protein Xekj_00528 [Xenorhabdus sp. KJ12.1]